MPARSGGFVPKNSVDVVPARRLEIEPQLNSDDDIAVALEELSYLGSIEATAKKCCNEQIRSAKATAEKALITSIDGRDVKFADRRAQLEMAIAVFADAHRGELFPEGKKTREFTFGTIAYRFAPAVMGYANGQDADSVLEKIEKRTGLLTRLAKFLQRKLFGQSLRTFVRLKMEVNIAAIKAAWSEGLLKNRQLAALGLDPMEGSERFSVEPGAYLVRSESAAAR